MRMGPLRIAGFAKILPDRTSGPLLHKAFAAPPALRFREIDA